jgi:hypothetical protein
MKNYLKISFLLVMITLFMSPFFVETAVFAQTNYIPPTALPGSDQSIGNSCVGLATMIATGQIHLSNLPCFIKYFTQTLVGVAGSIAVVFVMIGGYKYVVLMDEGKEAAKKTITHALIGLAVSLLAWVLIDLVIQVATE